MDFSDKFPQVVYANKKGILFEAIILLKISDWYGVVMEMNNSEFYTNFDFIKLVEGNFAVDENRQPKKEIDAVIGEIIQNLQKPSV